MSITETRSPYIHPGLEQRHKHHNLINTLTGYVCESYGVSVAMVKSPSRKAGVKNPRFVCMYMLRTFTDMTLEDIGDVYFRDHATVLHAVNDIIYQLDQNTYLKINNQRRYLANYIKELERKFITSKYLECG